MAEAFWSVICSCGRIPATKDLISKKEEVMISHKAVGYIESTFTGPKCHKQGRVLTFGNNIERQVAGELGYLGSVFENLGAAQLAISHINRVIKERTGGASAS